MERREKENLYGDFDCFLVIWYEKAEEVTKKDISRYLKRAWLPHNLAAKAFGLLRFS